MAAGYEDLDLESQHTDRSPLLMADSPHEHVINVRTASTAFVPSTAGVGNGSVCRGLSSPTVPQQDGVSAGETLSGSLSGSSSLWGQPSFPPTISTGSSAPTSGTSNETWQRTSPLNSGLWISIEFTITVSQIVASIIVLSLSRDEKPQAPLSAWVAGYAAGCLATLPLLYWRYTHRYLQRREQDSLAPPLTSPQGPSGSMPHQSYGSLTPRSQVDESHPSRQGVLDDQNSSNDDPRTGILVERFKIALDCFFAIWFVVGNVWIFGGHSSSSEAPNLYRLCIVFLTFSCIGYAMPFILCATICCCLPCIIALLGFREDPTQGRGASAESIAALPTYKFKAKSASVTKIEKDGNESDCEGAEEGGLVGVGTGKETPVSAEDAVCCICLGKYKDNVELRELPCTHHFHVECVDKWLKINASCPLCKHDIGVVEDPSDSLGASVGESTEQLESAEGVALPAPPS